MDYFYVNGRRLDIDGWALAEEFALPRPSATAMAEIPPRQLFCLRQHYPTGLFNGMIAGLVPMGLSGVIWYQGESNARRADAYDELFMTMIKSWRKLFEKPELPFAWCQLAGYMAKAKNPQEIGAWAQLRAAQTKALELPMTGQAILVDAGEVGDIHPRDKRTPGRRLAAWALNAVYGRKEVPFRGPHGVAWKTEERGGRDLCRCRQRTCREGLGSDVCCPLEGQLAATGRAQFTPDAGRGFRRWCGGRHVGVGRQGRHRRQHRACFSEGDSRAGRGALRLVGSSVGQSLQCRRPPRRTIRFVRDSSTLKFAPQKFAIDGSRVFLVYYHSFQAMGI